jgi:UDP-glucose 4-epimerase
MKAFITGGAGFIGRNLAAHLLATGHEVTIYDDFSTSKRELLDTRANIVAGNILDTKKVSEAMAGHDVVFHLAARSIVYGRVDPSSFIESNVLGTESVLSAMCLAGVKKIVFSSSQAVYGEQDGPASEESLAQPSSYYGASKFSAEAVIRAYCHATDMQAWILRLANITGTGQTHGVVSDFITKPKENKNNFQILGHGAQRKSYLLASECCGAMMFALENANAKITLLNIGSDETIEVKKIAELVAEEMKLRPAFGFESKAEGWPGDQTKITMDVSRLATLGWHSKYSQEETIRLAVRQILSG